MKNKIKKYNLKIDEGFFDFINNEVLPDTQIDKDFFWNNFSKLIYDFEPINQQLLKNASSFNSNSIFGTENALVEILI